jgi:Tfp pilus assembly protein PilF
MTFAALGLLMAGCADQTAGVSADDPGYVALQAKDYARARDAFSAALARKPHDPWIELDLGLSYQGLGQMDKAVPLYRQVLVDGKGVVPGTTTNNSSEGGRDLASIACDNLRLGGQSC